jgi:hypothetical protein
MDVVNWRGTERILIVVAAVVFMIVGFALYIRGIKSGRISARAGFSVGDFMVSAIGPGLGFMAIGGIILIFAILRGVTIKDSTSPVPASNSQGGPSQSGYELHWSNETREK